MGSAAFASAAVEPAIPPTVANRIAKAVESSRSEGTRRTWSAGRDARATSTSAYDTLHCQHPVNLLGSSISKSSADPVGRGSENVEFVVGEVGRGRVQQPRKLV